MTVSISSQRKNLLSSSARLQVPFVKVTIGEYTFGVYSNTTDTAHQYSDGLYKATNVIQYPNYVQSLDITKINGQINTYTLSINYPVTTNDDPNFFEKVLSSVSNTRKIVFSYGDWAMPSYIYKDEEAIITNVGTSFNFGSSGNLAAVITYTITAVSGAAMGAASSFTFTGGKVKPSDEIKKIFLSPEYGLRDLFPAMTASNLSSFIAGDDKEVEISDQTNISALDYINYLVGCMLPAGTPKGSLSKDIYILTLHDDTTYDRGYSDRELIDGKEISGAYFKVTRQSYVKEQADAFEIDIGYNTATIVKNFNISQSENYSLYYEYNNKLDTEQYARRITNDGKWEDIYSPSISSSNDDFKTRAEDISWLTKVTQYPIKASITVQGLLRPATLLQYIRLNVILPGGHKHISSGLYIVTQQQDHIAGDGWSTTLALTRIGGDVITNNTRNSNGAGKNSRLISRVTIN